MNILTANNKQGPSIWVMKQGKIKPTTIVETKKVFCCFKNENDFMTRQVKRNTFYTALVYKSMQCAADRHTHTSAEA